MVACAANSTMDKDTIWHLAFYFLVNSAPNPEVPSSPSYATLHLTIHVDCENMGQ